MPNVVSCPKIKAAIIALIASAVCVSATYFHFLYSADVVASSSNYFVSMLVVPTALALLVGYLSTLFCGLSKSSKLVVFISPTVATLALVMAVYLALQYGGH